MIRKLKNKKVIIIGLIIFILVIIIISILMVRNKEISVTIDSLVEHSIAEDLYDAIAVNECSVISDGSLDKMSDESLLNLIFGQMQKDKVLKDEITLSDYQSSARKILQDINYPNDINDYVYNGYSYSLNGDTIIRKQTSCDSKYVSKLYGYSSDKNNLRLDIRIGYIKNDKVYNLHDEEIGEYTKDSLNTVLDKASLKIYHYKKVNNEYLLENIESA